MKCYDFTNPHVITYVGENERRELNRPLFHITIKIPLDVAGEVFERCTGGKRKVFVKTVVDIAIAKDEVQAVLKSKHRFVTGWSFEPRSHISLKTRKEIKPVVKIPLVKSADIVLKPDLVINNSEAVVQVSIGEPVASESTVVS